MSNKAAVFLFGAFVRSPEKGVKSFTLLWLPDWEWVSELGKRLGEDGKTDGATERLIPGQQLAQYVFDGPRVVVGRVLDAAHGSFPRV